MKSVTTWGEKTLKRLEPKLNKLQNNWNIWTDLQYNIPNQKQAQAICRNWRGGKKGTKHSSPSPNSLILYIHLDQGKLNGKFAIEKIIEKKLMPIIRKSVLFHSYPILSHKRVISSHSCFKFFKTSSSPHVYSLVSFYFHCYYSNTGIWNILYLICGSGASNDNVHFSGIPLCFYYAERLPSIYVYFLLQQWRLRSLVFVCFTGTLWSESDMTEENSSELEAFRPR